MVEQCEVKCLMLKSRSSLIFLFLVFFFCHLKFNILPVNGNPSLSIWSVLILHDELYNCTRDLQKRFPRKEIWNIGRYPQCSRLTFSKLQILLIQIVVYGKRYETYQKACRTCGPVFFYSQLIKTNVGFVALFRKLFLTKSNF